MLLALAIFAAWTAATPSGTREKRFFEPVVTISNPEATIVGTANPFLGLGAGVVESFKGIPFAQPPVGKLRLKPPQPITQSLGRVDATTLVPASCPQYLLSDNITLPSSAPPEILTVLGSVVDSPLFKSTAISGQEDCLTINVQRPEGVKEGDKLPVILWIFGGGFELGSTGMYDGTSVVANAMMMGKPFVFAAMNYRVAAFGFLGGKEILADGSSNLGLLDQRLGMQWVADNIEKFGECLPTVADPVFFFWLTVYRWGSGKSNALGRVRGRNLHFRSDAHVQRKHYVQGKAAVPCGYHGLWLCRPD